MPINHADAIEFIRIGVAAIVAVAYCGWTWHLTKVIVEMGKRDAD